jgi:hypothetical protein
LKRQLAEMKEGLIPSLEITFPTRFASMAETRQRLMNKRLQTIYWRSPAYNRSRLLVCTIIVFILEALLLALDWMHYSQFFWMTWSTIPTRLLHTDYAVLLEQSGFVEKRTGSTVQYRKVPARWLEHVLSVSRDPRLYQEDGQNKLS